MDTEKTCPRCGFVTSIHAKKCPKCGLEPADNRANQDRKPYPEAAFVAIVGIVLISFGLPKMLNLTYSRIDLFLVLGGVFFLVWAFNVARDAPIN